MKKTIGVLLLSALMSCGVSEKDNQTTAELIGDWQGLEWLVFGKDGGQDASSVSFAFESDNRYTAQYGDQKEAGTFKVKGDKLYTTAENKIEKMVKIDGAINDTLKLLMNRMGQEEKLILLRK
jgi:hypothetical protein